MIPKFRAWDKNTNDVVSVKTIDLENDGSVGCIVDYSGINLDISECVLMQSTGLKDKNGVEIFEGDVIGSQNKDRSNWYVSHHKIVWHDTGFFGKQICSSAFIGLEYWTRGENGYVVIGNIYENPELLEQANEN